MDIAKAMGCIVIACASTKEKLAVCKSLGADFLIEYNDPNEMRNEIERITQGKASHDFRLQGGVDVVYDPIGGPHSEAAIRTLRFQGRHLVVGFASGSTTPKNSIPSVALNLALLNERQFMGVLLGTYKAQFPNDCRLAVKRMIEMVETGRLRPVVSAVRIEDWSKAMDDLMNRRVVGKIVFKIEADSFSPKL